MKRRDLLAILGSIFLILASNRSAGAQGISTGHTSLTDPSVKYEGPREHHVVLRRGPITAVIVDNEAVDVPDCPGHGAGYNGVAVMKHDNHADNLFVPAYAGLNFEHIHDGTFSVNREVFEPRKAPMQLRIVDQHTVELYQPPTPNYQLESCGRYHLLADGTIEYSFECIPRADSFAGGYIGLFWASYIHQPQSTDIYFVGRKATTDDQTQLIRSHSRAHGVDSTHPPDGALPNLPHAEGFPLTLVFNRSPYVHTEPRYYGLDEGFAFVQMFRTSDGIWFAQSPSGGGQNNPAWDFQYFIPDYKVGQAYGFVMRAALVPFENHEQLTELVHPHVTELNGGK